MRWATDRRIPLTPRGKGSSGYGGAIPVKKGLVVDFYRMRAVVDIDEAALTATVEPGITWEQLDREIAKRGLALRLYPTSYPSSSVGGWLAQGGADTRCLAVLPIEPSWMKLRGRLIEDDKRMTLPPFEMMSAALRDEGDIWAGYRKNRADWFPEDLWQKHGPQHTADTVYFAGCTASFVERDIGIGTVRLLDGAGVDFIYLGEKELCCATPMLVAGRWEQFESVMRTNIASVRCETGDARTGPRDGRRVRPICAGRTREGHWYREGTGGKNAYTGSAFHR